MDLCYILKGSSPELKYSIRSAEKCLEYGRLVIAGDDPGLKDIHHIPVKVDETRCKACRIMQTVKAICEDKSVSDDFIFVNDDYFFLKPIKQFPYWHKGTLDEAMDVIQTGDFYRHLLATKMVLLKNGHATMHFDCHYPIIYNKKKLLEVIEKYDWDVPDGYVLKSLYCNTLGIEGMFREDCKTNKKQDWERWTKNMEMFSSGDHNWDTKLERFLLYLYPYLSKYEHTGRT